MSWGLPKEVLADLRKRYPAGCRVVLEKMDDVQAPPVGTKGTVRCVDDIGSIGIAWDNGCGLSAAYGEDIVRRICPKCGKTLKGYPALSRTDNKTEICSDCGILEALDCAGIDEAAQAEILDAVHSASKV